MCLGIPARIIETRSGHPDLITVDVSGAQRVVNAAILSGEQLRPGQWVMLHTGFAVEVMDEADALASLEILGQIGDG